MSRHSFVTDADSLEKTLFDSQNRTSTPIPEIVVRELESALRDRIDPYFEYVDLSEHLARYSPASYPVGYLFALSACLLRIVVVRGSDSLYLHFSPAAPKSLIHRLSPKSYALSYGTLVIISRSNLEKLLLSALAYHVPVSRL